MSGSSWQGKYEIEQFLLRHKNDIDVLVDVGPGRGVYGLMANWVGIKTSIAVEIFPQYVDFYHYKYIYHGVLVGDFSTMELPSADCIVLGDVLEHLPKEKAIAAFIKVRDRYKYLILSIPIGAWPQGPSEGNIYEAHLSTWTFEELANGLCSTFQYKRLFKETNTGVFIK